MMIHPIGDRCDLRDEFDRSRKTAQRKLFRQRISVTLPPIQFRQTPLDLLLG
jgi:hypothetical protein